MREFDEFVKTAASDPMKRGYIAGKTIKGALPGAFGVGAIGASIPLALMDVKTSSKAKMLGTALATTLAAGAGAAIGGKLCGEEPYKRAVTDRVWANLTEKEKEKINTVRRLEAPLHDAYTSIGNEIDHLPDYDDCTDAQKAKLKALWKKQDRIRDKLDAIPDSNIENRAWKRSTKDLLNRGLLKRELKRPVYWHSDVASDHK